MHICSTWASPAASTSLTFHSIMEPSTFRHIVGHKFLMFLGLEYLLTFPCELQKREENHCPLFMEAASTGPKNYHAVTQKWRFSGFCFVFKIIFYSLDLHFENLFFYIFLSSCKLLSLLLICSAWTHRCHHRQWGIWLLSYPNQITNAELCGFVVNIWMII